MTLTKTDRTKLIQEMEDKFVTKEELANALADLVQQLPSRDEINGQLSEILGAINKKDENDAGHKMLHSNLGEDVPKLQQQVQHLFKTFEIKDPTEVAVSI